MQDHVKALGWIYIIFHAFGLLAGILVFVILGGAGVISGDQEALGVLIIVGTAMAFFLAAVSLPGIIGGIFLLKYENWARILVIIIGFLQLFNLPFGTILGIYTLWVLLNDKTIPLFRRETAPAQAPHQA